MSACALRVARAHGGQAAADELLAEAGGSRTESYLDDPQNWISLEEAIALLEAGGRVTGDQLFPRRVGEEVLRQYAGSSVATLLRSLGGPEAVLENVTATTAKFSVVSDFQAIEISPGHAV